MAYGEGLKRLSPCDDEFICALVAEFSPADLLDVGCGRGDRLEALSRRFPEMRLAGVDSDTQLAAMARERVRGEIHLASASELPFEDGRFEACLCECSLSLFSEPEKSLAEMHRVLRNGGKLILADIYSRREGAAPTRADDGSVIGAVCSREDIEELAEDAGFALLRSIDRSADLTAMAAQMIFDGSFCSCVGTETAAMLRRVKAGYGVWIFEKEEE